MKRLKSKSLTKRIDLNVGYSCNLKCRFCYYINDVTSRNKDKDLSAEQCKKLIRYHHRCGMKVIEFTGGEPTIRKDLFELVRYSRKIGFSKVSIITNGLRLANMEYAQGLVESGVSDFLFSLHGSTARTHDYTTGLDGSFDRLIKAIKNLLELGVKVRCNSVVTKDNIHDIYDRAELFAVLNVKTVNFIMFNPIEQASDCTDDNIFDYAEAAKPLKQVIDEMGNSFDKFTIRYLPFCFMPGYENHIQSVHQVHYDHDEWNYYRRAYIREPYWKWFGGVIMGLLLLPKKNIWMKWGFEHAKHAAILEAHTFLHKCKPKKCKGCSYRFICGGVWKNYAKKFGDSKLEPIQGRAIIEPWYFMTDAQRAEK